MMTLRYKMKAMALCKAINNKRKLIMPDREVVQAIHRGRRHKYPHSHIYEIVSQAKGSILNDDYHEDIPQKKN